MKSLHRFGGRTDFFAYGQVDTGPGRGGWRYHANYSDSDMSTTQWPPLAMGAAELAPPVGMGSTVPAFVREELPYFLDRTRHDACDDYHGGYGYGGDGQMMNSFKAAAGIICWEWIGTPLTDPNITGALGYLYRHWNDNGWDWNNQPIHGNGYGMYAVMKAMRIPEPDIDKIMNHNSPSTACDDEPTGETLDWYYNTGSGAQQGAARAYHQEGLAHYSIRKQHADGSWDDTTGPNAVLDAFSTAWQVLTLLEGVSILPPVAIVCDCDEQEYDVSQDIHLTASCSHHMDDSRHIVLYEWDLDDDGVYEVSGEDLTEVDIIGGFPDAGFYPVALRVEDDTPDQAQEDVFICHIHVHPPEHCPHAFAHPVPEGNYIGWPGVPIEFDASASWDPNDNIESYDWDLDNDGLYGAEDGDCFGESSDAVGIKPTWTWNAPYEGVIGLRVTDFETGEPACSDFDWREVSTNNHEPVSDPNGPYQVGRNSTIMLDGCASYDPDPGDAITYEWNFDADGIYDDGNECKVPFTAGSDLETMSDVCLKVTDRLGLYDIACTTVEIVKVPQACRLPNNTCVMLDPEDCENEGGEPQGPGTVCGPHQIPTVSEWGLIIITLMLLAGFTIALGSRRCRDRV